MFQRFDICNLYGFLNRNQKFYSNDTRTEFHSRLFAYKNTKLNITQSVSRDTWFEILIWAGMDAKYQENKPLKTDSFRIRHSAESGSRATAATRGRFVPRGVIATVVTLVIILIILVAVLGALLGKARSRNLLFSRDQKEKGKLETSFYLVYLALPQNT